MELKIGEYKDGRFTVSCIEVDVIETFDSLDEAIDKAQECLEIFRKLGNKEDAE